MKIALLAVLLMLAGCQSATDRELEKIVFRLDALEAQMNRHSREVNGKLDDVRTLVLNCN